MFSTMRLLSIVLSLAIFATGCSDQPGASAAMHDAEQVANHDRPNDKAFAVTELKRENGWLENDVYKVHFTYNLAAQVDYPQLVVHMLDASTAELKAMPHAERAALGMQVGLSSMMAGLSSEVPDVKAEMESYKQYPAIVDYIRDSRSFQDDANLLPLAVFATTAILRDYGIQKDQAQGAKVPRQVTLVYRKTEKGWQRQT